MWIWPGLEVQAAKTERKYGLKNAVTHKVLQVDEDTSPTLERRRYLRSTDERYDRPLPADACADDRLVTGQDTHGANTYHRDRSSLFLTQEIDRSTGEEPIGTQRTGTVIMGI